MTFDEATQAVPQEVIDGVTFHRHAFNGKLENIRYVNCEFIDTTWHGVDMRDVAFMNCNFQQMHGDAMNIHRVIWQGCKLNNISWRQSQLHHVQFMDGEAHDWRHVDGQFKQVMFSEMTAVNLTFQACEMHNTSWVNGHYRDFHLVQSTCRDVAWMSLEAINAHFLNCNMDRFVGAKVVASNMRLQSCEGGQVRHKPLGRTANGRMAALLALAWWVLVLTMPAG
jgi:uncharacterized protein YjbI with pentapeptide repeats